MATLKLQQKKCFSEQNMRKIISTLVGLMSSVSTLEDQCIKEYDETKTYQKGQIVVGSDGYFYEAVTVTNGVFDSSKWTKIGTDNFEELDVDTIKGFLGLTPEQLETMADLISTEIRLDKVFSSSDTYTRIDNALKEAKEYCLTQLAKKSTGSFKKATSTAEVTDGNYLYLILNSVTSKYDIYALVDSNVELLTSVDVNLDNYFTKTEIEADYLKKADADGKFATIDTVDGKVDKDKIVTVLDDTVTDEDIASAKVVYDELGLKANDSEVVKKTDIVTTINNTSTDNTVPSTKAVYSILANSLKGVKIMFFEFVNQFDCSILGINSSNTITEVVRAFANYITNNYGIGQYAILEISANSGNSDFTKSLPNKQACIITVKYTPKNHTNRVQVFLTDTVNGNSYIGTLNNSDTIDIVWKKVCTTTVADVANVNVTSSLDTTVATAGTIAYTVKNGMCYVRIDNLKPLAVRYEFEILPNGTLPKASTTLCYADISTWGENGGGTILLQPNTNGSLDIWCNPNTLNKSYCGMFSYPVAE